MLLFLIIVGSSVEDKIEKMFVVFYDSYMLMVGRGTSWWVLNAKNV